MIDGYEEGTGSPVDRDVLTHFAVLTCVSRSIMQQAGVDACARGETNALNLAGLGLPLVTANLLRAAEYAGWPYPEELSELGVPAEDDLRMRPDVRASSTVGCATCGRNSFNIASSRTRC